MPVDKRDRERAAQHLFHSPDAPRVRAWVETGEGGSDFEHVANLADLLAAAREADALDIARRAWEAGRDAADTKRAEWLARASAWANDLNLAEYDEWVAIANALNRFGEAIRALATPATLAELTTKGGAR